MKNLHRLLSLDHSFHGCLIDLMSSAPTAAELETIDTIFQRLTDAYTDFRESVARVADETTEEHDPNRTEIIAPDLLAEGSSVSEYADLEHPSPVPDEVVLSIAMDPLPEKNLLGEPENEEDAQALDKVVGISREILDKFARYTDVVDAAEVHGVMTVDSDNIEESVPASDEQPVASGSNAESVGKKSDADVSHESSVDESPVAEQETKSDTTDADTLIAELQAESDEYISLDDLSSMEIAASVPSASDAAIRVDEMLSRRTTADLRKAFTLNDKYRFRRELFGNSDAAMTDTLNVIDAMHSMTEAEDYLYGDLGWDEMQPDVKDFMAIVKSHFDTK